MNQRSRGRLDEMGASAVPVPAARFVPRPVDRLLGVYALVSGAALLFPHRPGFWPVLAVIHLITALAAFRSRLLQPLFDGLTAMAPRLARFIADWYPLLLVPALYKELQPLNFSIYAGHYFDAHIRAVEHILFGEPSRGLAVSFPNLSLSELLHGSYLSYYLIIYGPPLLLYARGRRADFSAVVFAIMLTFLLHYVFFIYYPVQGPRYLFPAPAGVIAEGNLYQLTHSLLEAGSSRGAAFPSSHVGVAVAQVVLLFRYLPRLAPFVALLALGLAAGAVYGGFHYATDVIAGALLGMIAALSAPSLARLLGDRHANASVASALTRR
jgi:membrane-associated phospholipid phosphatase